MRMGSKFKRNNYITDSESDHSFIDLEDENNSGAESCSKKIEALKIFESKSQEEFKEESSENLILDFKVDESYVKDSGKEENESILLTKLVNEENSSCFTGLLLPKNSETEFAETDITKSSVVSSTKNSLILEASTSSGSDKSVIDDSLSNSKDQLKTPDRIIEDSDSSSICEENLYINASSDSSTSEVEYVASFPSSVSNTVSVKNVDYSNRHSNTTVSDISFLEEVDKFDNDLPNLSSDRKLPDVSIVDVAQGNETLLQKSTSRTAFERSVLERQIADKTVAYQNIMRAVHGCDMKKLKDGGKLLQQKMLRCKEELDDLKRKFEIICQGNGCSPVIHRNENDSGVILSTKDHITSNLGKKGMETLRVQAALTIDALVTIHESLTSCPSENMFEKTPKGLRIDLMPHQKHGLSWLLWRERQTPSGGILADDMGLGKTLSVISLILRSEEYKDTSNQEEEENGGVQIINGSPTYKGKTLVVCPASLAGQWEGEIKKHCRPNLLKVVIHHGRTREYQAKRLAAYDVVITTYGLIAEENKCGEDRKKGILYRIRWERVVLDEAHIIRNHKTQKAVAACELIAKYRWCLTGTPVHNKELDLYSLLKFLRCSPFDDRVVWKRWVDNKSATGVARLKTVVKSILLRRTKEDLRSIGELTELPKKNIIPVYVELDQEELKFLEKEACLENGIEPEESAIEDLYTQLDRMSISTPGTVRKIFNNQEEKNVLIKANPVFKMERRSTKIQAVLRIIQEILLTDDKIIIVSQWTNLLKKLETHIRHLKVGIVTLDGSVPVKFRSKIINDFNEDENEIRVMLLSLNAGGVGLNLVGGNRLIIFEPHWNPQLESQACDRIYRVGQRKQVYIYKIICKDTIEERIELLQKKKLELAENILQGVNSAVKTQIKQLSLPDLISLFDMPINQFTSQ